MIRPSLSGRQSSFATPGSGPSSGYYETIRICAVASAGTGSCLQAQAPFYRQKTIRMVVGNFAGEELLKLAGKAISHPLEVIALMKKLPGH